MSKEATIVFSCEHCGQEIEVESSAIGMRCECPVCGGEITIPLRSTTKSKEESQQCALDRLYHVMEDFQKEVEEFKGSGLDLNSAMLSGTKQHMQGTLRELVELSKKVCEEVDAKGFNLDFAVAWPPKVSVSFDFERHAPERVELDTGP